MFGQRERKREEAKGITDEKRKVGLKSVGSTYRKTMLAWTPSFIACVPVYIYRYRYIRLYLSYRIIMHLHSRL